MTPRMACDLLNGCNMRELDRKKVTRFKERMLAGKWIEDNGYFITVRHGKLMNGRHRLTALVESGLTLKMRIQYDS